MKLFERFGDSGFHSAILSTYCLDFDAFDQIAVRRIRGAGARNILLISDEKMLLEATAAMPKLAANAGRVYGLTSPADGKLFHPKIVLQLGEKKARAIVSSANITAAGLAGNLEIATQIDVQSPTDPKAPLFVSIWKYLQSIARERSSKAVEESLDWCLERTPWLASVEASDELVTQEDGTKVSFFYNEQNRTICSKFLNAIGNDEIRELTIISPYWDDNFQALKGLIDALPGDPKVTVFIDPSAGLFPSDAVSALPGLAIKSATGLYNSEAGSRFPHAKVIIASGELNEHVLSGSANCTVAGLGLPNYGGSNHEACIYISSNKDQCLSSLGLKAAKEDEGLTVDLGAIAPLAERQENGKLPSSGRPGVFELQYGVLSWRPPNSQEFNVAKIMLSDEGDNFISELPVNASSAEQEYRLTLDSLKVRPHLARVSYDTHPATSPAIIADIGENRKQRRDQGNRKAQQLIDVLQGESEVTQRFLEIMGDLEKEERREDKNKGTPARTATNATTARAQNTDDKSNGTTNDPEPPNRIEYSEFIQARVLKHESDGIERDGLGDTYLSSMRQVLNRILLGLTEEVERHQDNLDLSLGDNAANSDTLENGTDSATEIISRPPTNGHEKPLETLEEIDVRYRQALREGANFIASKVDQLCHFLRTKDNEIDGELVQVAPLTERDLFRVRLTLTVIVAVAFDGAIKDANKERHGRVVPSMPSKEMNTWPRLLGKVLSALAARLIRNDGTGLQVDPEFDQLSDNILETWGTCFWCAQASIAGVIGNSYGTSAERAFQASVDKFYGAVGLHGKILIHPTIKSTFEGMSNRYADTLGLEQERLFEAHHKFTQSV